MKILLLGASGQVGWELQRSLAVLGDVTLAGIDAGMTVAADFSRPESLQGVVDAAAPDVVVNAAAHTAVDRCESEPDLARAINATAPGVLARAAAARGAWLVHYSTDYVFDGSGQAPWREDDATGALSVYGRTKLAGEEAVRASGCRHLVVRTSWVYGARGDNFAKTMLRLAGERETLSVVADQIGAPTGAELLADATAHMLRQVTGAAPGAADAGGTYHLAAAGECSWHGYARHVIAYARGRGRPVRVADDAIRPIASSEYPTPARRPANSRLDTTKIRRTFALVLPPWQSGIERALDEMFQRA